MLRFLQIPGRLFRLTKQRRRLLFQAALLIASSRLLLLMFPLKTARPAVRKLAQRLAKCSANAGELAWALAAVASRFPGTCLSNALAAHALLAAYGYDAALRIGATKKSGNFSAHAWVEHAGMIVVGGPQSVVQKYSPFPEFEETL